MKFDESILTGYLVQHLEALTEADPGILAEYVVALLKKDKPAKELEKLCADNLVEFLGHSAKSFVTELFQALGDGSVARPDEDLGAIRKPEPPQSAVAVNTVLPKSSPPKEDSPTSSGHRSDSEDEEISDDDDDDRNHKHRRRDARPNSSDNNVQEQVLKRPSRKRSKPFDNGPVGTDPHSNVTQREYNPTSERDDYSKFAKRRSDLTPTVRAPLELGPRPRVSQMMRTDPGPRFDLSTAMCRPPVLGRGRGRSTVPWSHNESRFNPPDMLDFPSQMGPQGSRHPGLFMGTGLQGATSTQNAPWGAFGFIPGIPNRILDPLLPLNLPGTFQPAITPPLNLGLPRQRCRDFEEQGFCLRGDMCPMEHGVNRIVVEDVQSLSQFNLPVSIPSSNTVGMQSGTGSLQVSAPLSIQSNSKGIPSKNSKAGITDDSLKVNGMSSVPGGEADVYDPDQPLWNNGRPEVCGALPRLPSPKPSWDADTSSHESFRLSEGLESEQLNRNFSSNTGSPSTNASIRVRVRSRSKLDKGSKISNAPLGDEGKEDPEEATTNPRSSYQGKDLVGEEMGLKFRASQQLPRPWKDSGHNGVRAKATRTLFVNGIPQHSNRKEALLSHFQKFGEVIDIYIPLNGEKAFVQFSKREGAEAALKAPDAVMGNRFIKLWWANRDRIPGGEQVSGHFKSSQSSIMDAAAVPPQLYVTDRGKGSMPSAAQLESSAPADETMRPVSGRSKNHVTVVTNSPKGTPPQKKLESLELLKEELRKKQAILDQKRDDFKRQLNKFEKQAISSKKPESVSEQAVKRHKEAVKASSPKSTTLGTVGACQEAEPILEKGNSGEVLLSPSSKRRATMEQSARNINQMNRLPAQLPNRFKLDNRPSSFKVLPPLPADLANHAALKDHFSLFGDLASVVFEEPETHGDDTSQGASENCSACVTFNTRHSAEKAYTNGKSWQGHNLLFAWLKVSPSGNNDVSIQRIPSSSTLGGATNAEVNFEQVTPGPSTTSAEKSPCSVVSEVTIVGNGESLDVKGTNHASTFVSEALVRPADSYPTVVPCVKSTLKSDVSIAADNIGSAFAE